MTVNYDYHKQLFLKALICSSLFHSFLLFALFKLEADIQAIVQKEKLPESVSILISKPDAKPNNDEDNSMSTKRAVKSQINKNIANNSTNISNTSPLKEAEQLSSQSDILNTKPVINSNPLNDDEKSTRGVSKSVSTIRQKKNKTNALKYQSIEKDSKSNRQLTQGPRPKLHTADSNNFKKPVTTTSKVHNANSDPTNQNRTQVSNESLISKFKNHNSINADSQNSVATQPSAVNKAPLTNELPRCKRCKEPIYPRRALNKGTEGSVIIRVMVAASGRVISTNLVRSSGSSSLDNAALKAASSSTFHPMAKTNSRTIQYVMNIRN